MLLRRRHTQAFVMAASTAAAASTSLAVVGTWSATPANNTWSSTYTTDWQNATVPVANGDTAVFNTAIYNSLGSSSKPIALNGGTLTNISFDTNAGSYYFNGPPAYILGGATETVQLLSTMTTSSTETFNTYIADETANGVYSFLNNSPSGTLVLAGGYQWKGSPTTLVLGGSNTNTNAVSSIIPNKGSDSGTLDKSGAGTWELSGSSYTLLVATNVSAGTLIIGNDSTAQTWTSCGTLNVLSGGTLEFNEPNGTSWGVGVTASTGSLILGGQTTGTTTYTGTISGGGAFIQSGAGTSVFATAKSYTGATIISAGKLTIGTGAASTGTDNSTSGFIVSGGSLAFNQSSGTLVTPTIAIASGSTVFATQAGGSTTSFNGAISGAGTFVQSGAGTSIFTTDESYNGATLVSAGTLQIGNGSTGTDNSTSGFTVGASGMLLFNQAGGTAVSQNISNSGTVSDAHASGIVTYSGNISGNGGFAKSGGGESDLIGTNSFTGATTISGGVLRTSNLSSTTVTVGTGSANSGTLAVGTNATSTSTLASSSSVYTFNGGGALNININNAIGAAGTSSGNDLITAAGIQTANTGPNAFTINLIDQGTINFNSGSSYVWTVAMFPASYATNISAGTVLATADNTGTPVTSGAFALNTTNFVTANGGAEPTGSTFSLEMIDSGGEDSLEIMYAAAPEPGTVMLVLAGAVPMLAGRRRRRQVAQGQQIDN